MWWDRAQSRLALEMFVGGVQPSRQYLLWYYQWAHVDGVLPEVHLGLRGIVVHRLGGRGQVAPDGSPVRADAPMQGVHADEAPGFEVGMTEADYLSLGLAGPSHPTPDTQAGLSQFEALLMQLQIEAPLTFFFEQLSLLISIILGHKHRTLTILQIIIHMKRET
ncbi:hypothetical protein PIB30_059864 [Stylosanthes scabra]|uniref:Uncharacterized protein n=1 Tax=Stylosanthes scabra TaxID=79078 RepID=A0ABU6RKQ4_9FABA|nr:hypothetical protein [Stylosanthes scabra]